MALSRYGPFLGWAPTAPAVAAAVQLNAAANWYAQALIAPAAKTLNTARAYASALTGTLASGDVTCDLYDSTGTNGGPGSSIETGKLPSATITAAGWYTWTGFSTALTALEQYWLVWKNGNGTPASNFPAFTTVTQANPPMLGTTLNRFAWGRGLSTNSGSSWTLTVASASLRVGYSDGSFGGMPGYGAASPGASFGVYAAREYGVQFTSPADATLRVVGLAAYLAAKTGSPTGQPRLGLWSGSTPSLLAYTDPLPAAAVTTAQWVYGHFSSVQSVAPGTVLRLTLGETTQSDASGNRWNAQEVSTDTDADSLAMLPWNGTCQRTYFDGSSWAETQGFLFPHALILDSADEFGAGSAGAGYSRGRLVNAGGA